MRRQLKLFDILCIGVNAIVGSGIFLLPGRLLEGAGALSIVLFLVCGVMLIPVGLCFAEAGSRVDRNGGPYNYARIAFGDFVGFALGWIAVVTAIFSYAAVANGLPYYLGEFIPGTDKGALAHVVSGLVIFFLMILNVRGVRLGANIINFFTLSKLVPLLLFVAVGLFFIKPVHFTVPTGISAAPVYGLLLAVVFTYQGFEVTPVPAGETLNPARTIPLAVMGSLILSGILYMVIQGVIVGTGAPVVGSERPLADAADFVLKGWGGTLLAFGALISMTGYCAGIAFSAPRFLTVLCEDRFLPRAGAAIHSRFQTPYVATIFISVMAFVMTLFLDFEKLVDISALAVSSQFLVTALAIPFLRKKTAVTDQTYVMPFGIIVPILGVLVSLVFIFQIKAQELIWFVATIAIGVAVSYAYRLVRGRGG
ncbi:MAG: amino acid permease [Deltaproteobacteria bacterium]|nr:amino acid permease [Deltaproteobacteria bacterium]